MEWCNTGSDILEDMVFVRDHAPGLDDCLFRLVEDVVGGCGWVGEDDALRGHLDGLGEGEEGEDGEEDGEEGLHRCGMMVEVLSGMDEVVVEEWKCFVRTLREEDDGRDGT